MPRHILAPVPAPVVRQQQARERNGKCVFRRADLKIQGVMVARTFRALMRYEASHRRIPNADDYSNWSPVSRSSLSSR